MFSQYLVSELNQKLEAILNSIAHIAPELGMSAWLIALIILDLIFSRFSARIWGLFSLIGVILITYLTYRQINLLSQDSSDLFLGMLKLSKSAIYFKFIFLIAFTLTILMSFNARLLTREQLPKAEYFSFLWAILLGLNLLVMSVNLLMIYLSLELISISSYILAAFHFNQKSAEGSIKYLLFGAFSSGLMLYGMSLLYGFTGTLQITDNQFVSHLAQVDGMAVFVAGFLAIAGLLFKISAIPFHLWTPDVYEAAPTPVVAFFSTAPKIAGILILAQFSAIFAEKIFWIGEIKIFWADLLAILAMFTIIVGNFSALWQVNAKRMLAYSAIAQAGFLLIPLIIKGQFAQQSLYFYLTVYVFMNFGAFLLIEMLAQKLPDLKNEGNYEIKNYAGLGLKFPYLGACFLVLMLALTGLPPTVGFTAKLLIFSVLWESYQSTHSSLQLTLFIVGLLNTAIALFYYLKIPFYLFFRTQETELIDNQGIKLLDLSLITFISLVILVLFFRADWLVDLIVLWLNG